MKQLLFLSVLLLGVLTELSAQTTANDSLAKAKVREIKLSEKYIYAEAISPTGFNEASAAAVDELRINVASLEAEQGKNKQATQETLQRLDSLYLKITYKQMSLFKAFVYVSPDALAGLEKEEDAVPTISVSPEIAPAPSETPEETPQAETPPLVSDSIAPGTPAEASFTVTDPVPVAAPDTTVATTANLPTETKAPTPVTVEISTDTIPMDTLPEKHQRVIGDLLALDTYEGIMLYLNAMKEDGRLMYGKMSALRRPEEAYLIIVKDGQLLTILDRGKNPRTNLKTHQPEDIRQYKGHAVIWLKVF